MKRILLLVCLMFSFVFNVRAQEASVCWGKEEKFKKDHSYCFSSQTMNWWSAFAWCDAQGRHLASISELCDYDQYVYGLNASRCPNKEWGLNGWTANVTSDDTKAYSIKDGGVTSTSKTSKQKAVCW